MAAAPSTPSTAPPSPSSPPTAGEHWRRPPGTGTSPRCVRSPRSAAEKADRTKAVGDTSLERLFRSEDVPIREKCLWRLLYETAARAQEVLSLNVEDVDLDNKRARTTSKPSHASINHPMDLLCWSLPPGPTSAKASTVPHSTRSSLQHRSPSKDASSNMPAASCDPSPARPPPKSTTTTTSPPASSPQRWRSGRPATPASASRIHAAPFDSRGQRVLRRRAHGRARRGRVNAQSPWA
ncbi:MAG: site-specific integrase [Nakamurella sp.]